MGYTVLGVRVYVGLKVVGFRKLTPVRSWPRNYPFNETYATLIPAILMGNSVVMKAGLRFLQELYYRGLNNYLYCFLGGRYYIYIIVYTKALF